MANITCYSRKETNILTKKDSKTDINTGLNLISNSFTNNLILKEHNTLLNECENDESIGLHQVKERDILESKSKENKIKILKIETQNSDKNGINLKLMGGSLTRFSKTSVDDSSDLSMEGNEEVYYSVFIPADILVPKSEDNPNVFTDKHEALKVMKQSKRGRFKQFKSREEAIHFAVNGDENKSNLSIINSPTSPSVPTPPVAGEKPMPFKGPKTQLMIQLRKAIECGDTEFVRKEIWANPRYLVSSGDTPSILQEGPRYNALHVAAKSKNVEMCRMILNAISSVKFIQYLYDEDDVSGCQERANVLLDLYLNMPDKGLNETPLHFSVKFGAVEVVELLTSYPQCQRQLLNKFNQAPRDIICSRVNNESEAVKEKIASLLEDGYYVPVLRYEDNTIQPMIGEYFSARDPLRLKEDMLHPRLEIQAYAGPMKKKEAELFRRSWKTPPRPSKNWNKLKSSVVMLSDTEKGLEKVGRCLASEYKVPWKEYWPFLDTFVDLSSKEGLNKLENYLKLRFETTLRNYYVQRLGQEEDSGGNKETTDSYVSPISDLCEHFKFFSLNDRTDCDSSTLKNKQCLKEISHKVKKHPTTVRNYINNNTHFDSKRKHEGGFNFDGANDKTFGSPLMYVEKSAQVYGKRMADAIYMCIICAQVEASDSYKINIDSLKDCLEQEVKHLCSLICSYKDDNRFGGVDFARVHSHVAKITCEKLCHLVTDREKKTIAGCLREIEMHDGTYSDNEDLNFTYNPSTKRTCGVDLKTHLNCFVTQLIGNFSACTTTHSTDGHISWANSSRCKCCYELSNTHYRKQYRQNNDLKIVGRRLEFSPDSPVSSTPLKKKTNDIEVVDEDGNDGWSSDSDAVNLQYFTPPSSPKSLSDDEFEEDSVCIPDTFIYPGDEPSKADKAVAEAIQHCKISHDEYPNIYRWKHLLLLHANSPAKPGTPNNNTCRGSNASFTPIKYSPKTESPSHQSLYGYDVTEPWERVLGPFSPRRNCSKDSGFTYSSSPV